MRFPLSMFERAKTYFEPTGRLPEQSLTRKEFYELTGKCREYARELARYDQNRVSLKHCNEFNQWLPTVKSYDLLKPHLTTLRPARPIARWQVLTIATLVGLIVFMLLGRRLGQAAGSLFLYGLMFALLLFAFFVPERIYGTTIEMLEGKVLRIVDALDHVLQSGELGFSEAAFFQVKEDLETSRRELRQQIDLAHRRWR